MDIRNLFTSSFLCFVFGSLDQSFLLIDNWPVLFNEDFPFLVLVALLDLSPSPFLAPFTLVRSEKVPRCPYSTLYRRNHNIVFRHRRISLRGDKFTFRDVARMKFHRDAMYGGLLSLFSSGYWCPSFYHRHRWHWASGWGWLIFLREIWVHRRRFVVRVGGPLVWDLGFWWEQRALFTSWSWWHDGGTAWWAWGFWEWWRWPLVVTLPGWSEVMMMMTFTLTLDARRWPRVF